MVKKILWTLIAVVACVACLCRLDPTHKVFARERYAANFLGAVRAMQHGMKIDGVLDRDRDGVAEFGSLGEILGHAERVGFSPGEIRALKPDQGEGQISDYYLARIFVPDDTDLAEDFWCAVAWPLKYGQGGVRTSFLYFWSSKKGFSDVNRLRRAKERRFSGWGRGPTLSDIFTGKAFESEINWRLWR